MLNIFSFKKNGINDFYQNLNKPSVNTPIITAAAVKDQRVAASAASAVTATDEVDPLAGSSSGSDAKCPSVVSSCGNPYTLSFSNQCTNYGKGKKSLAAAFTLIERARLLAGRCRFRALFKSR